MGSLQVSDEYVCKECNVWVARGKGGKGGKCVRKTCPSLITIIIIIIIITVQSTYKLWKH